MQNWSYNNLLSRLSSLKVGTTALPGSVFDRSYGYDNVGNIASIGDTIASGQPNAGTQTLTYSYDHRDRLTNAIATGRGSDTGYNESYSYDTIGNLTAKAGVSYTYPGGGTARPHTPSVVGTDPATKNYSYDANGNLNSGGGRSYTWNSENMPTGIIPAGGTVFAGEAYWYDGDGERIRRSQSGVDIITLGGGMWEEEYNGSGGKVNRANYSFNGSIIARREKVGSSAENLTYLHADQLGSTSVATSGTSQSVVARQEYDPWGKVRASSGYSGISQTKVGYTGQKLDGTGLMYYHARYYDPAVGKFTSADTIVPGNSSSKGGLQAPKKKPLPANRQLSKENGSEEQGNKTSKEQILRDTDQEARSLTVAFNETELLYALSDENYFTVRIGFYYQLKEEERKLARNPYGPSNPQALNRYSYVQNNPLRYIDPTGHFTVVPIYYTVSWTIPFGPTLTYQIQTGWQIVFTHDELEIFAWILGGTNGAATLAGTIAQRAAAAGIVFSAGVTAGLAAMLAAALGIGLIVDPSLSLYIDISLIGIPFGWGFI